MSLNQKGKQAGDWRRKTNSESTVALAGPFSSYARSYAR